MKENTNPESPNKGSIGDTAADLCVKKGREEEIAHAHATDRDENVNSATTDTLADEELFKIMPTEVSFFVKPTYKVTHWNGSKQDSAILQNMLS